MAHQNNNVVHKIMPHRKGGRYYNHVDERSNGFLAHTIYMFFKNRLMHKQLLPETVAQWVHKEQPDSSLSHPRPVFTWIGHSSFLIQYAGIHILTDPVFGNASFLYPRSLPAGLLPHELPPIDVVLLSHNHRDHMDEQSLLALKSKFTPDILVPHGDKAWFEKRGFERVHEHTWWQQTRLPIQRNNKEIVITFLPAIHWSQRGFFDKNRSLWGSWMIEIDGKCLYFAGDTSYSPHFKAIAHEFPDINLVFMPIGPCEPRAWMNHAHVNAQQAGQAFLDLNARQLVPMHWGTFPFGVDRFETPIEYLTEWWSANALQLTEKSLLLPKIGKSFKF